MPFAALGLAPCLVRAVSEQGYRVPTPIQAAAIPAILGTRDVWACAQTGSGKTAAFALPLLHHCLTVSPTQPLPIRSLILVPTRELAAQIGEACRRYARYAPVPLKIVTVFGGVSINPQMMALRGGADVVVATPGRLLDLVARNALSLRAVASLVLDEADRLLDLGFDDELTQILDLLPRERQNLLFSATFPLSVQGLAERLLHDPLRFEVPAITPQPTIQQRAIQVDAARRTQLLRHLFETHQWARALVFVATQYTTQHVAEKLRRAGLNAAPFHGELSQSARTTTLADFKAQKLQVVVATDVAARGLDIVQLPVVVNYDLPRSAVDYLHRIGRTGRAGAPGLAVSFISAENAAHFGLIEKRHTLKLPREIIEGFEPTVAATPTSPVRSEGGVKGRRKSKKDKLREAAEQSANAPSGFAWPPWVPPSS